MTLMVNYHSTDILKKRDFNLSLLNFLNRKQKCFTFIIRMRGDLLFGWRPFS